LADGPAIALRGAMDAINSQMDVLKAKPLPLWRRRPILVIAAAALAAAAAIVMIGLLSGASRKVERSGVLIAEVQQGDLQVIVDGYGVLRSNEQALITALSSATVQAVLLRPGAKVDADTIILRLANPDLMQELEAARIALVREQAKLRRLVLAGERDRLAEESTLAKARSKYQVQRMRNEAQKEAAELGIIPKIDYRAALANQDLLEEAERLQRRRTEHLKLVTREAQIIQQEEINEANAAYQRAQQRVEHLTVRAGIKGVLQRLPVELGQSVAAGQELALIGSDSNLLALLRISQSKADQIKVDQSAEINTRREKVPGVVT
jgi:HlyD family secretion protein